MYTLALRTCSLPLRQYCQPTCFAQSLTHLLLTIVDASTLDLRSPHVKAVYGGDGGIFTHMRPNTLLIDASTIDPAVAQSIGAQAEDLGARFVDAPVSGGIYALQGTFVVFFATPRPTATPATSSPVVGWICACPLAPPPERSYAKQTPQSRL